MNKTTSNGVKKNIFERLVIGAVSALPSRVRKAMKNVAFVIEEEARRKKVTEMDIRVDEVLLGLYEGIPLTGRDSGYFGVLPDKITIFQKPIEEAASRNEDKLEKLIYEVVWHEVGHHFGLSDRELSILEQRRQPKADPPPAEEKET